ncbi:hypothetical protein [Nitrosomonas sp.]|uniref:hypothetical protein n=1 Tax=Nitrosomonas sp. TaxID=42353 RepID=UPI0037C85722
MGFAEDSWDVYKDSQEWKEKMELLTKIPDLERRLFKLEQRLASNPAGHVCDHCGSANLIRIGNRPNRIFSNRAVKDAIFKCGDCNRESSFRIRSF